MKCAYFPCTQDLPRGENISRVMKELVAEAQVAEDSGFDACLISEHHQQDDGYIPNTILLAGMVGMRTEKLRVGTCVTLLPLQHPVHVAEDAAIVDQMTEGRMILSVGIGYQPPDFDAFGISVKERAKRSEEGIDIIRKSWSAGRFSYEGKHFQLKDVQVTPKPYKNREMPIWMAAWTDIGIKRTARMTDGWLTDPVQSVSVIKRFTDQYRSECEKLGKKPYVALMRDVWASESMDKAREESGPLMHTHRFYFRYKAYQPDEHLAATASEKDWNFDRVTKDRLIVGSPKDCLEQLTMWKREINPDYLVLRMRHPGGPEHKRTVELIRMFGKEVLPHL